MMNLTNVPWVRYNEDGKRIIMPQKLYIFLRDSGFIKFADKIVLP